MRKVPSTHTDEMCVFVATATTFAETVAATKVSRLGHVDVCSQVRWTDRRVTNLSPRPTAGCCHPPGELSDMIPESCSMCAVSFMIVIVIAVFTLCCHGNVHRYKVS